MDEQEYQSKIPPWCYYQTVEEHKLCLMLCWGIVNGMVRLDDDKHCRTCEFYTEKLSDTIVRDKY